jgi:hypothetical protein
MLHHVSAVSRGCVRVWNFGSNIKGGTLTEGVWAQGAEENIWNDGRLEKTA